FHEINPQFRPPLASLLRPAVPSAVGISSTPRSPVRRRLLRSPPPPPAATLPPRYARRQPRHAPDLDPGAGGGGREQGGAAGGEPGVRWRASSASVTLGGGAATRDALRVAALDGADADTATAAASGSVRLAARLPEAIAI
ncbi:hypothetical protein SETIT_4G069600v2, partial [Setaria italica]